MNRTPRPAVGAVTAALCAGMILPLVVVGQDDSDVASIEPLVVTSAQ